MWAPDDKIESFVNSTILTLSLLLQYEVAAMGTVEYVSDELNEMDSTVYIEISRDELAARLALLGELRKDLVWAEEFAWSSHGVDIAFPGPIAVETALGQRQQFIQEIHKKRFDLLSDRISAYEARLRDAYAMRVARESAETTQVALKSSVEQAKWTKWGVWAVVAGTAVGAWLQWRAQKTSSSKLPPTRRWRWGRRKN